MEDFDLFGGEPDKATSLWAEKPASESTEAGLINPARFVRPYLPVGAGGGGGAGGGVVPPQQPENPSVAAAKATRVKYFTIFIILTSNNLEPDFHLTANEPALLGVLNIRRVPSRSACAYQRIAPDRIRCEKP
jgi:hypothetical protein